MLFVKLTGEHVDLKLGRWNAQRAVQLQMKSKRKSALVELVNSLGIDEAARTLGMERDQLAVKLDDAREEVAKSKHLSTADLPILDLIDDLGYTPQRVARLTRMEESEVRTRYWAARARLRVTRHDEILCKAIPDLNRRDFAAYELVFVLNYSIARAARVLRINRGHLCRRLHKVQELLREHCEQDLAKTA